MASNDRCQQDQRQDLRDRLGGSCTAWRRVGQGAGLGEAEGAPAAPPTSPSRPGADPASSSERPKSGQRQIAPENQRQLPLLKFATLCFSSRQEVYTALPPRFRVFPDQYENGIACTLGLASYAPPLEDFFFNFIFYQFWFFSECPSSHLKSEIPPKTFYFLPCGFLLSQCNSQFSAQGPSDPADLQGRERILLPGSFSNASSAVENSSVCVSAQTCRALPCPELKRGGGPPKEHRAASQLAAGLAGSGVA